MILEKIIIKIGKRIKISKLSDDFVNNLARWLTKNFVEKKHPIIVRSDINKRSPFLKILFSKPLKSSKIWKNI